MTGYAATRGVLSPPNLSVGSGSGSGSAPKKYVTRACEACKKRKSKCDGLEPCARCIKSRIECAYRTLYNRGSWRHLRRKLPTKPSSTAATTADLTLPAESNLTLSHPAEPTVEGVEEPTEGENAVNSAGDASVHNFLHKVSEHLTLIGQGLPRNLLRWEEEILNKVGDRSAFVVPPRDTAREYLDCYFEHANVTYRYLLRTETFAILDRVYDDDETVFEHPATIAILLFAMGVGCIWLASRHNRPLTKQKSKSNRLLQAGQTWLDKTLGKFPPTLDMIKATVLKCQLECAASRDNSAWMTLGMAVRLGQIIGIEREVASTNPSDQFSRKGVFWAMYMLDRYLSVSLGRPMAIRDEDITIACPTDLDHDTITLLGPQETKVWLGVVAHARLTRIIGYTITRLYPASKHLSDDARDQAVTELERDLQEWENETPSFFLAPEQGPSAGLQHNFYAIPWIFQRQQKTITAAYHFTCILMYRGDLLREFLHHEPGTPAPSQPSSARIRHCVNHAMAIAGIAANIADNSTYNGVYWTTSHFVFCAISVLLVYLALYHAADDRGAIEEMVEKAMKGHRKLDSSYNFRTQRLLEESRTRAQNASDMVTPVDRPRTPIPTESGQVPPVVLGSSVQPKGLRFTSGMASDMEVAPAMGPWYQEDVPGAPNEAAPWAFSQGLVPANPPPSTGLGLTPGWDMIMDIGFDDAVSAEFSEWMQGSMATANR